MNIQQHLDRILLHHVDEWPQECWDDIWGYVKAMKFPESQAERFHLYSCALTIAAYLLTKLSQPPVIGAKSESALPADAPQFCDTMAASMKLSEPKQGPIKNLLVKRALAMLLTYAISIAEDSDKMQEIFDTVTEWIRERLK